MRKDWVNSWALAWLAAMVLIHTALFWGARELIRPGYPDFTAFYAAGASVRSGTAARLYDLASLQPLSTTAQELFPPSADLPFLHPPCEALLFAPLSFLSFRGAFLVWDVLSVLLLLACGFLLRSELAGGSPWLWLPAGLGFFPVFIALLQGQDSILLLLLFTLAYRSLKRQANFWAGVCLGLGMLRPQIVLPFLLILMFRPARGRLLAGFGAAAAFLACVSAWATNWRTALRYPLFLLEANREALGHSIFPEDMPNLRGLASQWAALGLPDWLVVSVVVGLSVLLILLAGRVWLRNWESRPNQFDDTAFAVSVAVALLVSYHIHLHDLSLLLLPAALQIKTWVGNAKQNNSQFWRTTAGVTLGALFFSPLYLIVMRFRCVDLLACLVLLFGIALALLPRAADELRVL